MYLVPVLLDTALGPRRERLRDLAPGVPGVPHGLEPLLLDCRPRRVGPRPLGLCHGTAATASGRATTTITTATTTTTAAAAAAAAGRRLRCLPLLGRYRRRLGTQEVVLLHAAAEVHAHPHITATTTTLLVDDAGIGDGRRGDDGLLGGGLDGPSRHALLVGVLVNQREDVLGIFGFEVVQFR